MILTDSYWLEGYSSELEEAWAEAGCYDEELEEKEGGIYDMERIF